MNEKYYQEYISGNITAKKFENYTNNIDVDGFIKQMQGKERAQLDERLKPVKDLKSKIMCSGLSIFGVGIAGLLGMLIPSLSINMYYNRKE